MSKNPTIPRSCEPSNDRPPDIARQTSASPTTHPHVAPYDLSVGYAAMAADHARETEAATWADSLIIDVADEPSRPS